MQDEKTEQNSAEVDSLSKVKKYAFWGISFSFEFIKTVVIVVAIAVFFRYFLIQPFVVVGQSMEPNFHDKEYLVVDKLSYKLRQPKRGEVVIFHPPTNLRESYIKRVIGLPGETVAIKNGNVYINDQLLTENYIKNDPLSNGVGTPDMTQTLASSEYFVFGDNRNHSSDSREIGPIPINFFQGRVMVVLYPFKDMALQRAPIYSSVINVGVNLKNNM